MLGFFIEDEHLLAASVLSAFGVKWVTNTPTQTLKFDSYDAIPQLVKRYLHQRILELLTEDLPQGESLTFHG